MIIGVLNVDYDVEAMSLRYQKKQREGKCWKWTTLVKTQLSMYLPSSELTFGFQDLLSVFIIALMQ